MVGIKPVADQFLSIKHALEHPFRDFGTLLSFGGKQIRARFTTPEVPVQQQRCANTRRNWPDGYEISASRCSRCS